jgi:hypothetical protein
MSDLLSRERGWGAEFHRAVLNVTNFWRANDACSSLLLSLLFSSVSPRLFPISFVCLSSILLLQNWAHNQRLVASCATTKGRSWMGFPYWISLFFFSLVFLCTLLSHLVLGCIGLYTGCAIFYFLFLASEEYAPEVCMEFIAVAISLLRGVRVSHTYKPRVGISQDMVAVVDA